MKTRLQSSAFLSHLPEGIPKLQYCISDAANIAGAIVQEGDLLLR